jgi:hypothetical protein
VARHGPREEWQRRPHDAERVALAADVDGEVDLAHVRPLARQGASLICTQQNGQQPALGQPAWSVSGAAAGLMNSAGLSHAGGWARKIWRDGSLQDERGWPAAQVAG